MLKNVPIMQTLCESFSDVTWDFKDAVFCAKSVHTANICFFFFFRGNVIQLGDFLMHLSVPLLQQGPGCCQHRDGRGAVQLHGADEREPGPVRPAAVHPAERQHVPLHRGRPRLPPRRRLQPAAQGQRRQGQGASAKQQACAGQDENLKEKKNRQFLHPSESTASFIF